MKRNIITILSVLALSLLMSCNKDNDLEKLLNEYDVVPTISLTSYSKTSISVKVYVPKGFPKDAIIGVCYSTSENPTIDNNCVEHEDKVNEGNKNVTITVSGLENNTTYYLKSYIKSKKLIGNDVTYSSQLEVGTANVVYIGDGTTNAYYPFMAYYKYSWCESVYLSSEMDGPMTISKISWYNNYGTASYSPTIKIYMGHASKNNISSTTNWTPSSNLALVYSGTHYLNSQYGFQTFELTTPFYYNGPDNLIIVVSKSYSSYTSSVQLLNTTQSDYKTMYIQSDSYSSYVNHPGTNSGTRTLDRPNIRLN